MADRLIISFSSTALFHMISLPPLNPIPSLQQKDDNGDLYSNITLAFLCTLHWCLLMHTLIRWSLAEQVFISISSLKLRFKVCMCTLYSTMSYLSITPVMSMWIWLANFLTSLPPYVIWIRSSKPQCRYSVRGLHDVTAHEWGEVGLQILASKTR